jgi:bacillolysin
MKNLFLVFLIGYGNDLNAQFIIKENNKKIFEEYNNSKDWLYFKDDNRITADYFSKKINLYININENNSFIRHRVKKDEIGNEHARYNHFYKGYRVMFSELITHEKNQKLAVVNGHVPTSLDKAINIGISETEAFLKAKNNFGAYQYSWENEGNIVVPFADFINLPKAELVWVQNEITKDPYDNNAYLLAYKFDIVSSLPMDAKSIFINAENGNLIRKVQLMADCHSVSVSTSFYGFRFISTQLVSGSTYRLTNDCNTAILTTINWRHNTYFQKVGNTWTVDSMRAAATSLWGLERTLSYFSGIHSYNSWDNGNGNINSYENVLYCYVPNCTPTSPNNASFYRGIMTVGWGNTNGVNDDWNSLDIVGHEFTHGISDTMAHLVYENESGALNESFSDIFGNTIQANELGTVANIWKMGENRTNASNQTLWIRDMEDPNNFNSSSGSGHQPDTYLGTYWDTSIDDNGGVHTNSGVQNYMYYLLVNGGTGTNDLGNFYKTEGLGIIPARRVAFKALVDYMDPNATHQTARSAWLNAAADLYGINSYEYRQVANAWYAVGVCANSGDELIVECGSKTAGADQIFYGFKYMFLANGCSYTINPAAGLVTYKAGTLITLLPGFTATQGSNFRASISDCTPQ